MMNLSSVEIQRKERELNANQMKRVRGLRGVPMIDEITKASWDPGSKKASLGGGKKKKGKDKEGGGNLLDESFELDTKSLVKKKSK
jgi:hypothetical protein